MTWTNTARAVLEGLTHEAFGDTWRIEPADGGAPFEVAAVLDDNSRDVEALEPQVTYQGGDKRLELRKDQGRGLGVGMWPMADEGATYGAAQRVGSTERYTITYVHDNETLIFLGLGGPL